MRVEIHVFTFQTCSRKHKIFVKRNLAIITTESTAVHMTPRILQRIIAHSQCLGLNLQANLTHGPKVENGY